MAEPAATGVRERRGLTPPAAIRDLADRRRDRPARRRSSRPTRPTRTRSATSASPSSSGSARPPIRRSTRRPRRPSRRPEHSPPTTPWSWSGSAGSSSASIEFAEALETGRQAVALSPNLAAARAVVVDALVELGRYDEAEAAAGEMLAIRADLSTLARVSYIAELHGKLDVALERDASGRGDTRSRAGERRLRRCAARQPARLHGRPGAAAADAYEQALTLVPAHAPSLAGEGRLAVGAGDLDAAIALFQRAADILPLPEYVIALAEAQAAAGRTDDAARNVKLARAEIQLFQASGRRRRCRARAVRGRPRRSGGRARAGRGGLRGHPDRPRRRRPGLGAPSARSRRRGKSPLAMRRSGSGSRDPLLRYHAGAIAAALGDIDGARRDLDLALATDPGFSATGAAEARRILDSLPD